MSRDDELQDYARWNDSPNSTHFTMEEIKTGRVEVIVIKDMSHLGRDYLKGDDAFTPFRNIMNDSLK